MPHRYKPRRYSVTREVVEEWSDRLVALGGQRLLSLYAQWEASRLEPQGWWSDGPVFLNFDRSQLELDALGWEFSVSVDTCDLDPSEVEGDDGESIVVIWRDFPWPELERFRGQPLVGLAAIEGHLDGMSKFKGMSLEFPTGSFCYYDAGDELGYRFSALPADEDYSDSLVLTWTLAHRFF